MHRDRKRAPVGTDARIDHGEVHCAAGERAPGTPKHMGTGANVSRGDVMCDVDQGCFGNARKDGTLHLGHVRVGEAEVGEERQQGHCTKVGSEAGWLLRGCTMRQLVDG